MRRLHARTGRGKSPTRQSRYGDGAPRPYKIVGGTGVVRQQVIDVPSYRLILM